MNKIFIMQIKNYLDLSELLLDITVLIAQILHRVTQEVESVIHHAVFVLLDLELFLLVFHLSVDVAFNFANFVKDLHQVVRQVLHPLLEAGNHRVHLLAVLFGLDDVLTPVVGTAHDVEAKLGAHAFAFQDPFFLISIWNNHLRIRKKCENYLFFFV